jgi:hypothetical protein
MPSEEKKTLLAVLAPPLKNQGFKKDGATWRKLKAESICVLNLQGSQWGPSFHVNLGVYFHALGENDKPAEYHCHLRARLADLVPDRRRVNDLLDFEKPLATATRFEELEHAIVAHGVPWLDRVSTIDGAREYCHRSKGPWVTVDARQLLGIWSGA